MCLNSPEKVKTDNDIICFKRLEPIPYALEYFKHGDWFEAKINNFLVSGKISIHQGKIYFCSDDDRFYGNSCPNKLGFEYSWELDRCVKDVSLNGKLLPMSENYITPYQRASVKIGETYTSEIYFNQNRQIEEALHSFKELENAFLDCQNENEVIVKCIIPKGSICYLGRYNTYNDSYASNALTYLEVIKPSSMTFEEFKSKFLSE